MTAEFVTEADLNKLATRFKLSWHAADEQGREGERVTDGLRAVLTELGVAVAAHEPDPRSVVRDRDGDLWERQGDRWACRTLANVGSSWADLERKYGPVTILRTEAQSA